MRERVGSSPFIRIYTKQPCSIKSRAVFVYAPREPSNPRVLCLLGAERLRRSVRREKGSPDLFLFPPHPSSAFFPLRMPQTHGSLSRRRKRLRRVFASLRSAQSRRPPDVVRRFGGKMVHRTIFCFRLTLHPLSSPCGCPKPTALMSRRRKRLLCQIWLICA